MRITKISTKNANGTFTEPVPIGADATNVILSDGHNVQETIINKINKPYLHPDGTAGQILKTLGNGDTEWVNPEAMSDEQVAAAFHAWQQDNPGWTTTIGPEAVKEINLDINSVSNIKIQNGAITSEKIGSGEVKTVNIKKGAVTSEKIGPDEVKTVNIDDKAITSEKIEQGEIKTINIHDEAVTSAKIGPGEVYTINIHKGAVTSEKIDDGEVKTINIDDEAVTDAKLAGCDVTEIDVRENIAQGETRATIFGKIKKWFTDLAPLLVESEWHKTSTKEDPLPYGFNTIDVKRRGKLVQVKLGANVLDESNLDSNGWKTIVTLPNEYWPTVVGPYNESSTQNARILGEVNTTTTGVKINVQDFGTFLTTVRTNGELQIVVSHGNKPGSPYSKLIGWINACYWYFIN